MYQIFVQVALHQDFPKEVAKEFSPEFVLDFRGPEEN